MTAVEAEATINLFHTKDDSGVDRNHTVRPCVIHAQLRDTARRARPFEVGAALFCLGGTWQPRQHGRLIVIRAVEKPGHAVFGVMYWTAHHDTGRGGLGEIEREDYVLVGRRCTSDPVSEPGALRRPCRGGGPQT